MSPTAKPVFVEASLCSVGDGGLDQVHELCWFPEGESVGRTVFSTARLNDHNLSSKLELYKPRQLGSPYYFNSRLFVELVVEAVQKGERDRLTDVVSDAAELAKLITAKNPVDIKGDVLNILRARLGLALGSDEFSLVVEEIEQLKKLTLTLGHSSFESSRFDDFDKILPFYRWLDAAIAKRNPPEMTKTEMERPGVSGHDPREVSLLLGLRARPTASQFSFLIPGSTNEFWLAAKAVIEGRCRSAKKQLGRFLKQKHNDSHLFELAASGVLVGHCID